MIDVSVAYPVAETYVQDAANTDGAAGAARGASKVEKYSCDRAGGYDVESVIVHTIGSLGEPAYELLTRPAGIVVESWKVDEGNFIKNTLKDMSMALCQDNVSISAAVGKVLAHFKGHDVRPRLPCPHAELT